MIYILAHQRSDLLYHLTAANLESNDPKIVLILSSSGIDVIRATMLGRKYDPDNDEIWMCGYFWKGEPKLCDEVMQLMSIFTSLKPNQIPCKNLCGY